MNDMISDNSALAKPRAFFKNDRIFLFVLSFLSLYIEMLLIRHLASEIRIFAYFKNLALIGAFLGLGFGYLYKPKLSLSVTALCLALMALATRPVTGFNRISEYLNVGDFNLWTASGVNTLHIAMGLFMLVFLFFVILVCMIPMGQVLAEIFDRSKNRIADYSINIFGSIVGIWFFAWISFRLLPPSVLYLVPMLIIFAVRRWNWKQGLLILALTLLTCVSLTHKDSLNTYIERWSPYQKIMFSQRNINYTGYGQKKNIGFYSLLTNSTIYMYFLNLSDKLRKEHPAIFPEKLNRYFYYDMPYNFPKRLDNVLVMGAGGGNDVAAALRAGAKHVTAVEIDPVIISFGKKYHPEQPYSSDRVTLINNDARNYLRNSDGKFDLIIMGLLDSHTLTSNFSNTNLDSYMYTLQSVGDMKKHLKDDGVLALSFMVTYPWIGAKIYRMVERQFGRPPQVINFRNFAGRPMSGAGFLRGMGGTYFIVSPDKYLIADRVKADNIISKIALINQPYAKEFAATHTTVQTDDWPYLYARDRAIPTVHIIVSFTLIMVFMLVYLMFFGRPGRSDLHFAALGAGFLLLEVTVISRFALFWGATWIVSSIVISMILIAILIANGLFLRINRPAPYPALYAGLAVMLIALYFTPLESNLVVALYLAPFTLIGYIFAQSFNSAQVGSRALAYNLFGALVGGLSESMSFVWGLGSLVLLALGFYFISFLFAKATA